jgi:mannitol-1-phosphate 5-dehydrogenase
MFKHIFVGFGFGPIQAGLFVNEAFKSGNFDRIVIAEIDQKLVDSVRANNGTYYLNVAGEDGVEAVKVSEVEIYNPCLDEDKAKLLQALYEATEIATSLPSVDFYDTGDNSVASLIGSGLSNSTTNATIIYTAENNNHAAEILEKTVKAKSSYPVQYLNTVIGKMSQVVTDPAQIAENKLEPIVPGIERAFLVEEFNRILVTKCRFGNFEPGIRVFVEKDDLLPFEEAKLYGHNAIHALLAYLGAIKGYRLMSELRNNAAIMKVARDAFLSESGAALIKKYSHLNDELFTEEGYKSYAEDLLRRMTNPYLSDAVERAARDPIRKLGYNDRIFGTMRLALEYGIEPTNMAIGAAAGIQYVLNNAGQYNLPEDLHFGSRKQLDYEAINKITRWLWNGQSGNYISELVDYVYKAGIQIVGKQIGRY